MDLVRRPAVRPNAVVRIAAPRSAVLRSVARPSVARPSVARPSVVPLKIKISEALSSLSATYCGNIEAYFASIGGSQVFLENYANILDENKANLLDDLGSFDGTRYPSDFDVGTSEKTFSWFFHYHDTEKKERGHFHLYATPKLFADPTATKKTHLISIELTENGDFAGFFIPNGWVIDDHTRPVEQIQAVLKDFHTFNRDHSITISIWLTAIIREFEDVIIDLLTQRDRFLGNMGLEEKLSYLENKEIEKICERVLH
jgi:hypothetical protein